MDSPLQITFKDTESSAFVEARVRERVQRLARFHSHIVGCRVVVEVTHKSPGSGKVPLGIAVEIEVPGKKLVARDEEAMREVKGDRTSVINRVFDAMERQLQDEEQVRRHDVKGHGNTLETGRITRLFPEQNYGFVEVTGGPDLYFSSTALTHLEMAGLEVGMMVGVTRAAADGPMGPQAASIRNLGDAVKMRKG